MSETVSVQKVRGSDILFVFQLSLQLETRSSIERDRAKKATEVLLERHGEYPFLWASPATIRHAWDFARERMGLSDDEGFIPYALRHTCATRLYAKTKDLMLVQKWMGHADIKMTLRYAKLQPMDLQNARDLLAT